ncbi:hypothetical protein [Legionella spiritensis]|uniref:Uncharacterized protein n=1 Tax=Legionella spiritensis TaxID=452 RepID=A0A0W0Z5B1_LEGSP|nr:hypothetical protein [Legionella spiritensis]KTD63894.1 hypothetical protein Lspi_1413 [Legionella spiritensis]SNV36326.1 Uncharacterised protein [Legionella spiritensis]
MPVNNTKATNKIREYRATVESTNTIPLVGPVKCRIHGTIQDETVKTPNGKQHHIKMDLKEADPANSRFCNVSQITGQGSIHDVNNTNRTASVNLDVAAKLPLGSVPVKLQQDNVSHNKTSYRDGSKDIEITTQQKIKGYNIGFFIKASNAMPLPPIDKDSTHEEVLNYELWAKGNKGISFRK